MKTSFLSCITCYVRPSHTQVIQSEFLYFLLYEDVLMTWATETQRQKERAKQIERRWANDNQEMIPATCGKVTGEKRAIKTCRENRFEKKFKDTFVDWWRCKSSPDGVRWYQELRSLSAGFPRVPFVSAWLQFMNLHDASSHTSPPPPPPPPVLSVQHVIC